VPIPGSILNSWSYHHSGKASIQAHTSIRKALEDYTLQAKGFKYNIFLQGSYKNGTNLHRHSDVDVVVQLAVKLQPQVATLSNSQLMNDQSHKLIFERWRLFRSHVLKALRAKYGNGAVVAAKRKCIKVEKGEIHASADVVVAVKYGAGLAFYLPDEHRWVVSYPEQHYANGLKKEKTTNNRFKRTIRMFKSSRNHLQGNRLIKEGTAPSYFIECLLYNVPDKLFRPRLNESYTGIVEYLKTTNLQDVKCQNEILELFGSSKDLWDQDEARTFIRALGRLWEEWPAST